VAERVGAVGLVEQVVLEVRAAARPELGVARGRPPVVVGPGLAARAPREALQVAGMAAEG